MAVLLCAVVVLAGCSDDEPDAQPTDASSATGEAVAESESTPSPGPSDSPGATATDEATDGPSPAPDPTAEIEAEITQFFEEYIDVVNESWSSEDALERRREMFADSCQECLHGYELTKRKHDEGLVFDAGEVVVSSVQLTSIEGGSVVFMTVMDSPSGALRTTGGEVVQEFDEYVDVQSVYQAVRSEAGDWIIVSGEVL
ncbi:hypothetical protein [Phytoactinopolyspora halotolerans]|uniref:Uncharacterized protein n=1 Tax=Phytoactinopolyspora halotolerans TaxID=1981512 RepID=A0A6L9SH50_9ACTN|nr:hypothetical protein [Phytoactinopolyspora halotolerans]NEE03742.1 hypothetical protein [Phytoactinopolyspora halotolerans]